MSRETDDATTNGRYIVFSLGLEDAEGIEEYARLLQSDSRYGLSLRTYETSSFDPDNNGYVHYYVFDYVGSGSVTPAKSYFSGLGGYVEAAVVVQVNKGYHSSSLAITYSKDFRLADNGDRSTDTSFSDHSWGGGSGSSGSSGGSGSYSPPCNICNGTGKCKTCGGDGYLYSSASHKEDRNCWACNRSGRCSYCGGTGRLYN